VPALSTRDDRAARLSLINIVGGYLDRIDDTLVDYPTVCRSGPGQGLAAARRRFMDGAEIKVAPCARGRRRVTAALAVRGAILEFLQDDFQRDS